MLRKRTIHPAMENTANICTQNKMAADSFPHPLKFATAPVIKDNKTIYSYKWSLFLQKLYLELLVDKTGTKS
jgi:hypothetical protein